MKQWRKRRAADSSISVPYGSDDGIPCDAIADRVKEFGRHKSNLKLVHFGDFRDGCIQQGGSQKVLLKNTTCSMYFPDKIKEPHVAA